VSHYGLRPVNRIGAGQFMILAALLTTAVRFTGSPAANDVIAIALVAAMGSATYLVAVRRRRGPDRLLSMNTDHATAVRKTRVAQASTSRQSGASTANACHTAAPDSVPAASTRDA
jgi:uncharacterized protein YacL